MASASTYNLLIIDDIEQDKLLYNTSKLKETIAIAKHNNKKKIQTEIKDINSQILFLQEQLNQTLDDKDAEDYKLLHNKLKQILNEKLSTIENMSNPSIGDIKKTHEIFLNSQFKPWVESTFEYSKVSVNSKPQFGESVEFTIPSYGNFLSDMLFHIKIGELITESI